MPEEQIKLTRNVCDRTVNWNQRKQNLNQQRATAALKLKPVNQVSANPVNFPTRKPAWVQTCDDTYAWQPTQCPKSPCKVASHNSLCAPNDRGLGSRHILNLQITGGLGSLKRSLVCLNNLNGSLHPGEEPPLSSRKACWIFFSKFWGQSPSFGPIFFSKFWRQNINGFGPIF